MSVCCDVRVDLSLRNFRLGTGSVDGPSALMEEVRGQQEHHNKQNNDKEGNKVGLQFYFTITTTIRCY